VICSGRARARSWLVRVARSWLVRVAGSGGWFVSARPFKPRPRSGPTLALRQEPQRTRRRRGGSRSQMICSGRARARSWLVRVARSWLVRVASSGGWFVSARPSKPRPRSGPTLENQITSVTLKSNRAARSAERARGRPPPADPRRHFPRPRGRGNPSGPSGRTAACADHSARGAYHGASAWRAGSRGR